MVDLLLQRADHRGRDVVEEVVARQLLHCPHAGAILRPTVTDRFFVGDNRCDEPAARAHLSDVVRPAGAVVHDQGDLPALVRDRHFAARDGVRRPLGSYPAPADGSRHKVQGLVFPADQPAAVVLQVGPGFLVEAGDCGTIFVIAKVALAASCELARSLWGHMWPRSKPVPV
jgi:hypothetical protein